MSGNRLAVFELDAYFLAAAGNITFIFRLIVLVPLVILYKKNRLQVLNVYRFSFPIRLNNRLSSLRRSVETGDAKPTDGAYKVFEELTAELEGHLNNLKQVLASDLAKVNQELQRLNLKAVEAE